MILPWKMVDPLMRQHGLESVRLRVGSRPRQVVVRVGRVHLVEPVGVADLKKLISVFTQNTASSVPLWLSFYARMC